MLIRHGDLCLKKVKNLPDDLQETKTKILMTGSGGNDHAIDNGKVYLKQVNDFVFGYLIAKDTKLLHPEHGKKIKGQNLKEVKLDDGIYELRKQHEETHEGMVAVVD